MKGATSVEQSARCGACRRFDNAPHSLEAAIPGLLSLGSAHSAARSEDGLCQRHHRYLSADYSCPFFENRSD